MSDLLARGKTSGQMARLMLDPVRRKLELRAEEEAAERERDEKARSKTNAILMSKGACVRVANTCTPVCTPMAAASYI